MGDFSFLGNAGATDIEGLYRLYLEDPDRLEADWRLFFEGFEFARLNYPQEDAIRAKADDPSAMTSEFKVMNLINGYRERGHFFTRTNPVRTRRKYHPTLDHQHFGLEDDHLLQSFQAGHELGIGEARLTDIIAHLKETYCQGIGVEYMYIRSPEVVEWLKARMEKSGNRPSFNESKKLQILHKLIDAVGFEHFLRKRFPGQKGFSLEGSETLIPALDALIEKGANLGIREYVIGMAHRGRLNVLGNILKKPFHKIFSEFDGKEYAEASLLGDVKYHMGCTLETVTEEGNSIKLSIAPNPSHLEAVDPVVQGLARAKIDHQYQGDSSRVASVLIHGDASIAGQGIVYEVVQMSELEAYKTGGSIHLIINNQLGFTTNYLDARSSTYCTDVAKVVQSPIFHVNGDDVEAVVYTIELAMEFRQKFQRDVFIDLLSYRKWGHNEGDEPRFTQPILYKIIERHPDPASIYIKKLSEQGLISDAQAAEFRLAFEQKLDSELKIAGTIEKGSIDPFLEKVWKPYKKALPEDFDVPVQTKVSGTVLCDLAEKVTRLPEGKQFFRKTIRLMEERRKMVTDTGIIDWAMGETLAYATLLAEGHQIRFSGQDVERGTFSHRHAVLKMEDSEEEYIPLSALSKGQATFGIYNSLLSEYGVLGFEYGYAMGSPDALVVWEAQFGDFGNGAQIIIDQFISSAEEKWKVMNGLVMMLPHGYEGQGPEHSSARMERFLSLCAGNNMVVANCTTPASLFHLLRRHLKRTFRKPLILFTPKSLLRHPACVSKLGELIKNGFSELIDDHEALPELVERVVFCSGKIYYELLEEKQKKQFRHTALIRLEQLYPLPINDIQKIRAKYAGARRMIWVQEEPRNMGAWPFLTASRQLPEMGVIARPTSGSPASGSSKFHAMQQRKIIEKAFEECDCVNVCAECEQLCISHLVEL